MALKIWLPLNGNSKNKGLLGDIVTTSAPTYTTEGKIGQALATGGFKMLASQTEQVLNNNEVTIAFWIYVKVEPTDSTKYNAILFGQDAMAPPNNRKFSVYQYPTCNDLHLSWQNETSGTFIGSIDTGVLPSYKWTHVCIVYKNPVATVYINGEQYTTHSGTSNSSSFAFDTQLIYSNSNRYINDFRIYDEALSPKQVKEISKGLIAHYKLDNQFRSNRNITLGYYGTTTNSGWGAHRGTATYTNDEDSSGLPFKKVIKFVVTYDTSLGSNGGTSVYPTNTYYVSGSTQYTYSAYIKSEDDLAYVNGNFLYRYEYDANGTKLTEAGVCSRERLQKLNNGWYRIWGTFTTQENTVRLTLPFYTYCGKNNVYYLGGQQLEPGDVMTPYIDSTYNLLEDEPDCSGNGYIAIKNGTLIFNNDSPRYSGSTTFGANSLLNSPAGAVLASSGDFTIGGWFYRTNSPTYYASADTYNTSVCLESGRYFVYGANGTAYVGNWTSQANVWQHVMLVHDSVAKTLSLFVNGAFVSQVSTIGTIYPNSILNIGGRQNAHSFNGSMSDFRIYATALSADDILAMYKNSGIIDNKNNVYAYEFKEE